MTSKSHQQAFKTSSNLRLSVYTKVRNRAKELTELLSDIDKIKAERKKARQTRSKYTGTGGGSGFSSSSGSGSRYEGFSSDSYPGNYASGNGSSGSYAVGGESGMLARIHSFFSFFSLRHIFVSFLLIFLQILSANNVIFTFITIPSFTSTLLPTQASKMTTHQPDTTILIGRVVESAATDPSPSAAVTWTLIRALRRRRAGPPTTGRTRLTRSNPRKKPRPQRKKLIYSTLTSLLPRPPKSRTSGEICRRGREEVG